MDIFKEVSNRTNREIIFINSNLGNQSHDIDIYCVTKGGESSTHCFWNEEGVWTEIFIDSIENVEHKINTVDCLGINYLTMLPFFYGDREIHNILCEKANNVKQNYNLYDLDAKLYAYRIRISYEKIVTADNEWNKRLFINAMTYPIIQYLLGKYHIFQKSPRNWIEQLKETMGNDYIDLEVLFDGKYDYEKIGKFVEKYIEPLSEINLYRLGKNRSSRVE